MIVIIILPSSSFTLVPRRPCLLLIPVHADQIIDLVVHDRLTISPCRTPRFSTQPKVELDRRPFVVQRLVVRVFTLWEWDGSLERGHRVRDGMIMRQKSVYRSRFRVARGVVMGGWGVRWSCTEVWWYVFCLSISGCVYRLLVESDRLALSLSGSLARSFP